MVVPVWAKRLISEEDVQNLRNTINNIEAQAHGEIVIVVMNTCTYHRLSIYLWWMMSLIFSLLVFFLHQSAWLYLISLMVVVLSLTRDEFKRFWLSSAEQSVKKQALLAYYQSGLDKIESQSGILIFLSLFERQVHVLAGPSILKVTSIEAIQQIVQDAIPFFKQNQIYSGLMEALKDCEHFLLKHFKKAENKKNEFRAEVIFLES